MKRIFFIQPLVEKLRSEHPPKVTFRTRRHHGTFAVYSGGRFHPRAEDIVIKVWSSGLISTADLTDQDAQDAGLANLEELFGLFRRWYGDVPAKMFRNEFVIIEPKSAQVLPERKVKVGCLA